LSETPQTPLLIKDSGEPFTSDEIADFAAKLNGLDADEREHARNANAAAIASHDAPLMLVVSGPGTGKSTLFKSRIGKWLIDHPDLRVAVATFVRKLARDLHEDISSDSSMAATDKKRVDVTTLHRLARSIVEQGHGSVDLPLRPHCRIVAGEGWEEMVWTDAVRFAGGKLDEFPWTVMLDSLYDGEPLAQAEWLDVRQAHLRVQQFYNALTFPDLILQGTQAVVEKPELAAGTLFIIDEFQDFNLAEAAFIRAIAAESPGLLLAGDDDQVLYDTWRRGHASIIRDYYRDPGFINAMLPYCSRCSLHVCSTAAAFLAVNPPAEAIQKLFLPLRDEATPEVSIVAATSPTVGVAFVEQFLKDHAKNIEMRQAALDASAAKDPYLLVLTPDRSLKFLKQDGAKQLQDLLDQYTGAESKLCDDYWRVRDYYFVGVDPSQNYGLRKVLAYEELDLDLVASLIRRALDEGKNFAALGHDAIVQCTDKTRKVKEILDGTATPKELVEQLAVVIAIPDPAALERDLNRVPITRQSDTDDDGPAQFEQSDKVAAVEFTSIVGAKGLSADHVLVLGCDDSNLQRTSRNAFFVALTRARESLTLLACIGGGGASVLHDFVVKLPDAHATAIYLKADGPIKYADLASLQNKLSSWAYAKKKQMEKAKNS